MTNVVDRFTPVGNNVLVELVKDEEVTQSGIVISRENAVTAFGKRVAVVRRVSNINPPSEANKTPMIEVSEGDRVLVQSFGGTALFENDIEYRILPKSYILGVLK